MTRLTSCIAMLLLVGGCATGSVPHDPLERFNRGVYRFNDGVDKALLKPVAQGYRTILPEFVQRSVGNFFSNTNDVAVALNNALQGKFTAAVSDVGRVAINSTLGLLGLFDVASEAGIEKHNEDFGQTLGYWGMPEGPFIMLPLLGPSNGRDVFGRIGDFATDPVTYVDPTRSANQLRGARIVHGRAELLDAGTILDTAALDPYQFVRDAYIQRRRNLIHDGILPLDPESGPEPPPGAQSPAKPRSGP